MEEFNKVNPLQGLHPVWTEDRWSFVSLNTNKTYSVNDLMPEPHPDVPKATFDLYVDYVESTSEYWLASDFLVHWLKQLYELNSVYVAEAAYQNYLKEHLVSGVKKPAKVYKAADTAYDNALNNYMNTLKDK